jgi:hypothetical protein
VYQAGGVKEGGMTTKENLDQSVVERFIHQIAHKTMDVYGLEKIVVFVDYGEDNEEIIRVNLQYGDFGEPIDPIAMNQLGQAITAGLRARGEDRPAVIWHGASGKKKFVETKIDEQLERLRR